MAEPSLPETNPPNTRPEVCERIHRPALIAHMRERIALGQLGNEAQLEAVARSARLAEDLRDEDACDDGSCESCLEFESHEAVERISRDLAARCLGVRALLLARPPAPGGAVDLALRSGDPEVRANAVLAWLMRALP